MPALLVTMLIMHVVLNSLAIEASKVYLVLLAVFRMVKYVLMTMLPEKATIVLLQAVTLVMEMVRRSLTTPVRMRL